MYDSVKSDGWYALFVKSGQEDNVKERLKYRFGEKLRIIVPKRRLRERRGGKWIHVIRNLFPGYVLVHGEIGIDEYYDFKNIPGLFKLLCSGYEPAKIKCEEMEIINRLMCNSETIGYSDALIENGNVVIIDGPLVSLEGRIVCVNRRKGRVQVALDFMGEPRIVELGISVLQPA